MIIDKEIYFLVEQTKKKGPKALYEMYRSITDETGESICHKSMPFLKAFVNHQPDLCEGIIRNYKGAPLSIVAWGYEYLLLLTYISVYYLDEKETNTGLFWAKKALDLVSYFVPNDPIKRSEIQESMPAIDLLRFFPDWPFDDAAYNNSFLLDWEIRDLYYRGHDRHFNDNE